MGFKKNNPGCNCCATECPLCADDFNRTDDVDIDTGSPCGWGNLSGTYEILSNELHLADSGRVICSTEHPVALAPIIVTVEFKHDTSGGYVDIILGYVDANNYHYARYTVQGASGSIDMRKVTAGTHSSLNLVSSITMNTNTWYTAQVCGGKDPANRFVASLDGTALNAGDGSAIASGSAGLATGVTGNAYFDDWDLKRADDDGYNASDPSNSCEACPTPSIGCSQCADNPTTPPLTKILTVTGMGAGVTCNGTACGLYNGIFYLTRYTALDDADRCFWRGVVPGATCNPGTGILNYWVVSQRSSVFTEKINATVFNEAHTNATAGLFCNHGGANGANCFGVDTLAGYSTAGDDCDQTGATGTFEDAP